jgi:iron(III) transport system ATP-binding protein
MPELVVQNLTKRFGETTVLQDVSFTVKDGEFFTLLGASGCGKSTTLNCVAGLERPDDGSIRVGDKVFVDTAARQFLPPEGRNLGMVFQSYALWPHMTVADNLALPLKIREVPKDEQRKRIDEALDKVGLLHLRERYPHQLSGGQQQRVALARSLAYSPTILLLDEPLSNLDAKLREQARAWLKRLQEDVGITTVYVTHDQHEALALSDRIAVMSDGRMLQVGTPTEIYERPAVAAVAAFIGRYNFLKGAVVERADGLVAVKLDDGDGTVRIRTDLTVRPGQRVTVAVRPECLTLRAAGETDPGANVLAARVLQVAYVGARHEYELVVGDTIINAEGDHGRIRGDVTIEVDPDHSLLYADEVELPAEVRELTEVTV